MSELTGMRTDVQIKLTSVVLVVLVFSVHE
jgi:hypothetical protein